METSIAEPRLLSIENENNKFSCNVFSHITLAPPQFSDNRLIGKVFFIEHNDQRIHVQLIDYEVVKFLFMESMYTLPSCALTESEWKKMFLKKYPNTTDQTRIGIYVYQRIAD